MVVMKLVYRTGDLSPATETPVAPGQTIEAAQAFDVATLTDLSAKAVDLANTVSHLPFLG